MALVTLDEMRDSLLTVSQVRETLATTEPLSEQELVVGETNFSLDPGWSHGLDAVEGTDVVKASVSIGTKELLLTKDALFQATSACGLPIAYVKKTPSRLIESHLNYWYGSDRGLGDKDLKLLVTQDMGSAITRSTVNPFSNLRLLDETLLGIEERYGEGEVLVDSKFYHSLARTHLRLIVPENTFKIEDSGTPEDIWSMGINLSNSLTGAEQTSLDGYLFRWWCSNGAIDTNSSSGKWSRRSGGQEESEVYEWARSAVDEVLGGLEGSFEALQEMARTPVAGDVNQILRETFVNYKLPARNRQAVIANLVEDDQLTMYSLMNAITSVANSENMDPRERAVLMGVGGDLVHAVNDRCDSCHRLI